MYVTIITPDILPKHTGRHVHDAQIALIFHADTRAKKGRVVAVVAAAKLCATVGKENVLLKNASFGGSKML